MITQNLQTIEERASKLVSKHINITPIETRNKKEEVGSAVQPHSSFIFCLTVTPSIY